MLFLSKWATGIWKVIFKICKGAWLNIQSDTRYWTCILKPSSLFIADYPEIENWCNFLFAAPFLGDFWENCLVKHATYL